MIVTLSGATVTNPAPFQHIALHLMVCSVRFPV